MTHVFVLHLCHYSHNNITELNNCNFKYYKHNFFFSGCHEWTMPKNSARLHNPQILSQLKLLYFAHIQRGPKFISIAC